MVLAVGLGIGLSSCAEEKNETPGATTAIPQTASLQTTAKPHQPAAKPVAIVDGHTLEVYQWYCAQCHGVNGKGDGINARFLTVPPRDHTKAEYLETRTDQQFFEAIKNGGLAVGRAPCMPAWGHTLDDESIHSLVRYIRQLCKCEAL